MVIMISHKVMNSLLHITARAHFTTTHTSLYPALARSTMLYNNKPLLSALGLKVVFQVKVYFCACSKIGHCSNVSWLQALTWHCFLLFSTLTYLYTLQLQISVLKAVLSSHKQWWPKTPVWMQNLWHFNQRKVKENKISVVESHQNIRLSMSPCSRPAVEKTWWLQSVKVYYY